MTLFDHFRRGGRWSNDSADRMLTGRRGGWRGGLEQPLDPVHERLRLPPGPVGDEFVQMIGEDAVEVSDQPLALHGERQPCGSGVARIDAADEQPERLQAAVVGPERASASSTG